MVLLHNIYLKVLASLSYVTLYVIDSDYNYHISLQNNLLFHWYNEGVIRRFVMSVTITRF